MEFLSSSNPVNYSEAIAFMEDRVEKIHKNKAEELIWFLEHPPLYTAGTSAKPEDILNPEFPVFQTGRGGQYTYHGNGQLIAYCLYNLKRRQEIFDLRAYIEGLERWIINSLQQIDVKGKTSDVGVGIWVDTDGGLKKIAAIGVRVRHGITYHGISLNINPNLSHYSAIIPCGIKEFGVTSLEELGFDITRSDMELILRQSALAQIF